jgi:cobalamin biosynthesis Mg chelatase CobN
VVHHHSHRFSSGRPATQALFSLVLPIGHDDRRRWPAALRHTVASKSSSGQHESKIKFFYPTDPPPSSRTMADDNEMNGDDVGWWDCSLCTYRNSAEKFKCEICDLRRGTSTRKPRCSTDTIVAQVVKQQEQIRQQTKAKPSPKSRPARENPITPEPTTSSPHNNNHSSAASTITNASTTSTTSSTSTSSTPTTPNNSRPHQSQDNPVKIKPVEINGNLIKYLPPTSTGRTGLIIDKKRFTQHSVTVDDVTITFTEFATRQNKYVRKKKKRSGKAASGHSSTGINVDSKL